MEQPVSLEEVRPVTVSQTSKTNRQQSHLRILGRREDEATIPVRTLGLALPILFLFYSKVPLGETIIRSAKRLYHLVDSTFKD